MYPQLGADPVYHQVQRMYTEPISRNHRYTDNENEVSDTQDASAIHQLDVDLDAYSTTGIDREDGLEDREPTLSFVTTSTAESTASTPSVAMSYGYRSETIEGKPESEPRIRMRTTAGRTNAYPSAESSTESGAFSYHAYGENQIHHPHPPPLPLIPDTYVVTGEHVGLGITAHEMALPARHRDSGLVSPSSKPPPSPSTSFVHRPWQRDVVNRLRSDSVSSSVTTASVSSNNTVPSVNATSITAYPYDGFETFRPAQEQDETKSEAVAMVDEGRGKIIDTEKLAEMGGIESLTEEMIGSLAGTFCLV